MKGTQDTRRLSSLIDGSLGRDFTLNEVLGRLIKSVEKNDVIASQTKPRRGKRAPLPQDIVDFIQVDLKTWKDQRNNAIHGMAKLAKLDDTTFDERYQELRSVALDGVCLLLELDKFDQREKYNNGVGYSTTWPDALLLNSHIKHMLQRQ